MTYSRREDTFQRDFKNSLFVVQLMQLWTLIYVIFYNGSPSIILCWQSHMRLCDLDQNVTLKITDIFYRRQHFFEIKKSLSF